MEEPIKAKLVQVDFPDSAIDSVLVTVRVGDKTRTYRAGNYLLIEADEDYRPIKSD